VLLKDERRKVWVCGPGLGVERAGRDLAVLLRAGRQVVADADALTACAGKPDLLRGAAVLTPHEGSSAVCSGRCRQQAGGRAGSGEAHRRRGGAESSDTVIAAPDGRAAINEKRAAVAGDGGQRGCAFRAGGGAVGAGLAPFEAAAAAVGCMGGQGSSRAPGWWRRSFVITFRR